jgi:hypothetical protein
VTCFASELESVDGVYRLPSSAAQSRSVGFSCAGGFRDAMRGEL